MMKLKKAGNCIFALVILFLLFGNITVSSVLAYNSSYDFVFDYEGDWDTTHLERDKGYSYDPAYINCTWAEINESSFETWLYAYNSDDGDYIASDSYLLGEGDAAWVQNGVPEGDTVWFRARLYNDGGTGEGACFSGRWRPDSSYY